MSIRKLRRLSTMLRGAAASRPKRRTTGFDARVGGRFCALALAMSALCAHDAVAQVAGVVEIQDRRGETLVRNPTASSLRVDVAVWESDESRTPIELLRKAQVNVWPTTFDLAPGETQLVRLSVPAEAYERGVLLRLETKLRPTPAQGDAEQVGARMILATRVLSKLLIR